jgi:hypothetical protein
MGHVYNLINALRSALYEVSTVGTQYAEGLHAALSGSALAAYPDRQLVSGDTLL